MARRAIVFINWNSRNGQAGQESVLEELRNGGVELQRLDVQPSEMSESIVRAKSEVDMVIVGGGDGTIRCAAHGLVASQLPVGILPLGTANDLARSLGIPGDLKEACSVITGGKLHRIDVGVVNGSYFFYVAHVGLGSRVNRELRKKEKSVWGVVGYAKALLRAFKKSRAFCATVKCDEKVATVEAIELAIGNGRHYGGGMTVAAPARLDDRLLHVHCIRPLSLARLLWLAPLLRKGFDGRRQEVRLFAGRQVEVSTERPMIVTADGEEIAQTPARFGVLDGAVQVFVPANSECAAISSESSHGNLGSASATLA
jgi:YegS/Rv2252/BmrU family lipid kinase